MPLPISSKLNPIHYPLPATPVKSTTLLTSDPHSPLNASLSAPLLISSTSLSHSDSHTIPPTGPALINATTDQPSLTDDKTLSYQPTTVEDSPGSGSQSSSVSPDELCCNQAHTETDITCSAKQLTHYDKFFPELEDQGESITKTQSSPQLSPEGVCGEHEQCRSGEGGGEKEDQDSSCHIPLPSLVIPTALSVADRTDSSKLEMGLMKGASSHSVLSNDDPCTATVNSVMPFVETPAPHIHGHVSSREQELMYKKKPSVERFVYTTCNIVLLRCLLCRAVL